MPSSCPQGHAGLPRLPLPQGRKRETNRLNSFETANRLSHFLWSSLPDNELFQLAKNEKLRDRAVFKQQIERLLNDPRSQAFVDGFAESWLRLDKLGTMPPASLKFREYYRYGLQDAMLEETHRFLDHAIKESVPLTDFIHSDYGFLNQDLARHYGINGIEGIHIRKVSFPGDSMRGGLLGQGSILTLTANGVDTSPVIRGIWVLESLLGTPPAPPPPGVEPIDPDVQGAKTVKDLLEKHRSVQACADCHAKIDPYGFALEYFDPVGATARLTTAHAFGGIQPNPPSSSPPILSTDPQRLPPEKRSMVREPSRKPCFPRKD